MKRLISAIVLVLAIVGPAWALSVDLRIEWELPTHFAVSDTDCSDGETVIPAADLAALVSTVEYRIGGGPVQVATTSARFIEVTGVAVGTEVQARVKAFLPGGEGCWTEWTVMTVPVPTVGCCKQVTIKVQ
jgi:hypothetical protein